MKGSTAIVVFTGLIVVWMLSIHKPEKPPEPKQDIYHACVMTVTSNNASSYYDFFLTVSAISNIDQWRGISSEIIRQRGTNTVIISITKL